VASEERVTLQQPSARYATVPPQQCIVPAKAIIQRNGYVPERPAGWLPFDWGSMAASYSETERASRVRRGLLVRARAAAGLAAPGMEAFDNPTLQALRAVAAMPDHAWSAAESACVERLHHVWALSMYVHTNAGGRIQFWRCGRCGQHKLQIVNSGKTLYAASGEGYERHAGEGPA